MSKGEKWISMPETIIIHNGGERCDMLIGACSCGAWHTKDDWRDKIPKEILKEELNKTN